MGLIYVVSLDVLYALPFGINSGLKARYLFLEYQLLNHLYAIKRGTKYTIRQFLTNNGDQDT